EIAVFFDEGEGVHGPVFAFGFDHVFVREQENRLQLPGAAVANDDVGLGGNSAADEDIGSGETGGAETARGGFGHGRGGACGEAGFNFDEFLVDVAGKLPVGVGGEVAGGHGGERKEGKECESHVSWILP